MPPAADLLELVVLGGMIAAALLHLQWWGWHGLPVPSDDDDIEPW